MFKKLVAIEPVNMVPTGEERLKNLAEEVVLYRDIPADNAEMIRRIGDAEAVYTNKTPLSASIIDACPHLAFIGILATGYNGAPSGLRHCGEIGCLRQQLNVPSGKNHELCRALHAEQNALIQAARYGISVEGATLYVNTQPCVLCAKMIINADIKEVVYQNPYPDELAMSMLEESGIKLRVYEG